MYLNSYFNFNVCLSVRQTICLFHGSKNQLHFREACDVGLQDFPLGSSDLMGWFLGKTLIKVGTPFTPQYQTLSIRLSNNSLLCLDPSLSFFKNHQTILSLICLDPLSFFADCHTILSLFFFHPWIPRPLDPQIQVVQIFVFQRM